MNKDVVEGELVGMLFIVFCYLFYLPTSFTSFLYRLQYFGKCLTWQQIMASFKKKYLLSFCSASIYLFSKTIYQNILFPF